MQAAKVRAAQRGESLKDLFARAIALEVGSTGRGGAAGRITFPLIGRDSDPRVEVTNEDIADALDAEDAEDAERYGQ